MITVICWIVGWISMAILTGALMYWIDTEIWTETPLGLVGSVIWPAALFVLTIVGVSVFLSTLIKTHHGRTQNPPDRHTAG